MKKTDQISGRGAGLRGGRRTGIGIAAGGALLAGLAVAVTLARYGADLRAAAPVFLLEIVAVAALAGYLTGRVLRPLGQLLSGVSREEAARAGGGFAYIRWALEDVRRQNTQLTALLNRVRPEVTAEVFRAILTDPAPDLDAAAAQLAGIGGPFCPDGRYIVGCVQCLEAEDQGHGDWLSELCTSYWTERAHIQLLPQSEGRTVFILQFEKTVSGAQIKSLLATFAQLVSREGQRRGAVAAVEAGRAQLGIGALREAYLQVKSALARRRYYGWEPDGGAVPAGPEDAAYIAARVRQMVELALGGEMAAALEGLSMVRELAAGAEDAAALYRQIHDILVEALVKCHVDTAALTTEQTLQPPFRAGAVELEDAVLLLCRRGLELAAAAGQRGRSRHVENARKYVADHYMEHDLSLEEVSTHVGVSTSYLSRLFTEKQGQGFLDYLNQFRIEKAKELLLHTGFSISEVGYQAGFASAQSFIRVFKKYTGVTPGRYTDQIQGR